MTKVIKSLAYFGQCCLAFSIFRAVRGKCCIQHNDNWLRKYYHADIGQIFML